MRTAWSIRRHATTGVFALVVLLGGFGSWAVLARLSGAVILAGQIEHADPTIVVQHLQGGVVRSVLAEPGKTVAAGDVLLRFDDQELRHDLTALNRKIFEIRARRARLRAELAGAPQILFEDALTKLASADAELSEVLAGQVKLFETGRQIEQQQDKLAAARARQIKARIKGLNSQVSALLEQQRLARQQFDRQKALAGKGLATNNSLPLLESNIAQLRGEIGSLQARISQAEEQLIELDLADLRARSEDHASIRSRLQDLELRQAELGEQHDALSEKLGTRVIEAPISGTVIDLKAMVPGSVVAPGEQLMQIVPRDRRAKVMARVLPGDASRLFAGQPARIRVFPASRPEPVEVDGFIERMSADTLEDPRTGQQFYRVELSLSQWADDKLDAELQLLPGMPAEVFIQTGRQPVWAYLAKPFVTYFARALRDS